MSDDTIIRLKKSVVKELKAIRRYPRGTYNETIMTLIKIAKESERRDSTTSFCRKFSSRKWMNYGTPRKTKIGKTREPVKRQDAKKNRIKHVCIQRMLGLNGFIRLLLQL